MFLKTVISILFIALAFLTASSHAKPSSDAPKFSVYDAVNGPTSDFEEVADLVLQIVKKYPPAEYLYVGVGRSPTPITAMMRAWFGDKVAINVPLSAMGYVGRFDQTDSEWELAAYQQQVQLIQTHLQSSMPSEEELGARKLLIIDFATTGKSLLEQLSQFHHFAYDRAQTVANKSRSKSSARPRSVVEREVRGLAIGVAPLGEATLKKAGIPILPISRQLTQHYLSERYSDLAEYGPFYSDALANYKKPAPQNGGVNFSDLVHAYREHTRTDGSLMTEISGLPVEDKVVLRGVKGKYLVRSKSPAAGVVEACIQALIGKF